jgi:hypothetical protein
MAGTYSYKAPDGNSTVASSPDKQYLGTGKTRIYQAFEKNILLDELSLPSQPTPNSQTIENKVSLQYPLIKINDYIIGESEIGLFEIDSTGFIPKVLLKVNFMNKLFLSKEAPKDGDIISVAIRNKNDVLKSIRNDYVITSVVSSENNTAGSAGPTMTFFGVLFIPFVSSNKFNFSFEGTSFEAMKKLAKDLGLGFATNENNTDDKQVWLSGYSTLAEFMSATIERSWKDNASFYNLWIDIYYNLNFVNVNSQLMSSEDEIDSGAWLNNIDHEHDWGSKTKQSESSVTAKVFSNYDGYESSPFYIRQWKAINNSTKITFEVGSKLNCNIFEHNQKLYDDPDSTKNWSIPLEPTYDENKINKYILLRGRATQDPSLRGNDLAKANYSFPDIYIKNPWMGIQYTISNPTDDNLKWDGNHHRNYLRAKVQNLINNKELEKLNVQITVKGLNMNVIKGDKTPIVLINKDGVQGAMANKESAGLDYLEQFYSGWFYVPGFKIKYKPEETSSLSNFSQVFTLSRREWPPPKSVSPIAKPENN